MDYMKVKPHTKAAKGREQLLAIRDIGDALVSNSNLDDILKTIIKSTAEIVCEADCGSIALLSEDKKQLTIEAVYGYDDRALKKTIRLGADYRFRAIREERPLILSDPPTVDPLTEPGEFLPVRSAMVAPLIIRNKILGVISLESRTHPSAFGPEDLCLLSYVASQAAIAVENARLYATLDERAREAILLYKAAEELSSTLSLDIVLERILTTLKEIFNYNACAIRLFDEQKQELQLRAAIGYAASLKRPFIKTTERSLNSWVAQTKELVAVADVTKDPRYLKSAEQTRSEIVIPLQIREKFVGTLDVESPKPNAFGDRDLRMLLALAVQISIALENARLFEESKKQAERLKESETKYRTLIEKAHDVVLIAQDEKIKYANNRFVDLTGYSPEEAYRLNFLDLVAPQYKELVATNYERRLGGENISPYEIEVIKKDGGRVTAEITASRIEYEGRLATLVIVRDITEPKRLREQLLQSEKLAAIGQLVSGVAHELNNPLASVLGFSQLILMRSNLDEKTRSYLKKVYSEAERTTHIVRNLLAFARQHKPGKVYIDANQVLDQTLALRSYELRVNNIEVIKEFTLDLPWIFGDEHQLKQVFLNIIINAEQAMLETYGCGKLVVRTACKISNPGFQQGSEPIIQIQFTDSGPGIPKANLSRIFDPFFTTKGLGKGTGLGLSISYGIIQEHNGKIYAESEEGKGASFIIELPIGHEDAVESADGTVEHDVGKIEPKHVLIIDDEPEIVELVSYTLRDEGHKIEGALNVNQALEKLKDGHFDLIISDLKMPKLGGKDLYFLLKEQRPDLLKNLIFMTGDVISPQTEAFFKETGIIYINKPFSLDELIRTILRIGSPPKSQ